jgi:hypothetical protein
MAPSARRASVVSSGTHAAFRFTRTGLELSVRVNVPSGFAVTVLFVVVSAATATLWRVDLACAEAAFSAARVARGTRAFAVSGGTGVRTATAPDARGTTGPPETSRAAPSAAPASAASQRGLASVNGREFRMAVSGPFLWVVSIRSRAAA